MVEIATQLSLRFLAKSKNVSLIKNPQLLKSKSGPVYVHISISAGRYYHSIFFVIFIGIDHYWNWHLLPLKKTMNMFVRPLSCILYSMLWGVSLISEICTDPVFFCCRSIFTCCPALLSVVVATVLLYLAFCIQLRPQGFWKMFACCRPHTNCQPLSLAFKMLFPNYYKNCTKWNCSCCVLNTWAGNDCKVNRSVELMLPQGPCLRASCSSLKSRHWHAVNWNDNV